MKKNYKKKTAKMLFENTNFNIDSCRKTAYQIKNLAKDLASFENISEEQALYRIGFKEDLTSVLVGEVDQVKKLGIVIDPFFGV